MAMEQTQNTLPIEPITEHKPKAAPSPESASTADLRSEWSKLSEVTGDTSVPDDGRSSPVHEPQDPATAERLAKMHRHAYSPSDVGLCERFADIVKLDPAGVTGRVMLVRMVRMLQLCDYTIEDVLTVLSLAAVHLAKVFEACPGRMDDTERASITVLQCYNAHCFVLDEACPLKYWRKHVYGENYCSLRVLNAASMKLFKILKYNLCVPEADRLEMEAVLRAAYI
jgi:hypothetical protein